MSWWKIVALLALTACQGGDDVAKDVDTDVGVDSDPPDTDTESDPPQTANVPLPFSPVNTDDIDFDQTSALLEGGEARAQALRQLRDPGTGSDGGYDGSDDTLSPSGRWTSFALRAGADPRDDVRVDGDLTIRAAGSVTIERDLQVSGELVIIAGGGVTVSCATVRANAVHIEAHGAAGLRVDCGDDFQSSVTWDDGGAADAGLALWSVGPMVVGPNGIVRGPGLDASDPLGLVFELLADGDLSILEAGAVSPGDVASDARPAAVTRVWTGGDLLVDQGRISSRTGGALEDQPLDVRAGGGVDVVDGEIAGSSGSSVDLRAEGVVRVVGTGPLGAAILGGSGWSGRPARPLRIWSRGLELDLGTVAGGTSSNTPAGPGADLELRTLGDVVLGLGASPRRATVEAGGSFCGAGGDLLVEVAGELRVATGHVSGGVNQTTGCTGLGNAPGGHATVRATGDILLDPDNGQDVLAGTGAPPGTRTVVANDAALVVAPPAADVDGDRWLTSVAQPAHGVLDRVEFSGIGDVGIEVLLPGDTDWTPVDDAVGRPLAEGWRWRARLGWSIFAGSSVRWVTFYVDEPI